MARKKTVNLTPRKKIRKPRKPMSEEQKKQAVERLAKARAKRAAANPPTYKNIAPSVVALPDDAPLSLVTVRKWIKYNRELLAEERKSVRQGIKGAEAKVKSTEGYIRNMERYLRDGDWCDDFTGENQDTKVKWTCTVMAYYDDGTPKRTKGVYYPDLGYRWGEQPKEKGLEGLFE
jgi:hypothetical protein